MCMSPDEMSDDRIAEVIEYYQSLIDAGRARGFIESGYEMRRYRANVENFQALLAERNAAREAEIDEAMASVTAEAPVRETVGV